MNDKELKDWTFQELNSYCTWRVMEGLLKGEALYSLVNQNNMLAVKWRGDKDRYENEIPKS